MQSSETADLVERLEDAQMALGSMASNRFGTPFRLEIISWLGKLGVINEQVSACKIDKYTVDRTVHHYHAVVSVTVKYLFHIC